MSKPVRSEQRQYMQQVWRQRERQQQRRAARLDWGEIIIHLYMLRARYAPLAGRDVPRLVLEKPTRQQLSAQLVGHIDSMIRQLNQLRSALEQLQAGQRLAAIQRQRGPSQQQSEDGLNLDDVQVKLAALVSEYTTALWAQPAQTADKYLTYIRTVLEQLEPIEERLAARRAGRELRKVVAQHAAGQPPPSEDAA